MLIQRTDTVADSGPIPGSDADEDSIPALFARQAARRPDACALVSEGREVSYAELDGRSSALALLLVEKGVGPGDRVGVCAPPSVELVVALLAVLKAGAAYVPFDPEYPRDRLGFIARDTAPSLVLVDSAAAATFTLPGAEVLAIDASPRDAGLPLPPVAADAAAYIIHTSGSSGRPKGVVVAHRNVIALLAGTTGADGFACGPGDTWTLFHSFAFDFSVWELWGCLLTGGRLVLLPRRTARDPESLHALLVREGVTVLNQTPSAFSQLVAAGGFRAGGLSVRLLIFGGEALDPSILVPWMDLYAPEKCHVVNMYGITETTVHCTWRPLTREDARHGTRSIGRPIPGWRLHVLDEHGRPVGDGEAGEIYVGGAGVAAGYANRPALTARRFVPDHLSGVPGERLYRSGDLGRLVRDGEFEHLGRIDDQVKIRGHRIELGEISGTLLRHPLVTAAAVAVCQAGNPAGARLDAYVVTDEELDGTGLRDWLAGQLPAHMVPATVTRLGALPLTPNGKLDRDALPAPRFRAADAEGEAGARGALEEVLCGLFAQVLELDRVGPEESFFDLGGHSLLATRLAGRVRDALDSQVGIQDLFDAPTPRGLAARLDRAERRSRPVPVARTPRMPVSHAQARLWLTEQLEERGPRYNIPWFYEVAGNVDAAALRSALEDVVARHESLRTVFDEVDGAPVQRIVEPSEIGPVLTCVSVEAGRAAEVAQSAARHTFDLSRDIPVHAWLIASGPERHTFVVVVHHIACDGWSMEPLARDLSTAYAARLAGHAPRFAPLPVQYADYAVWQREQLGDIEHAGSVLHGQLEFWRAALRDLPAELALPYDRSRPARPTHQGGTTSVELGAEATRLLERTARENGATVFMALQAGVAALLRRYGAGSDIPLGTVTAARPDPALDDVVGFFVNTLVLRVDLAGAPSFRQVLRRVRETDLAAYAHQDLPLDQLVDALRPARIAGRNPLFQTAAGYTRGEQAPDLSLPGARVSAQAPPTGTAKFDLAFLFHHEPGESITVTLEYAAELFDPQTAEALTRHLKILLADLPGNLDTPIAEIEILTDQEKRELAEEWDRSETALAPASLAELFEAQVRSTPRSVALVCGDSQWSYAELNAQANRLARELVTRGIGPGSLAALALPRGESLVLAVLAVLKTGGAYLPIDISYPLERIGHMLTDAAPDCLITLQDSVFPREFPGLATLLIDSRDCADRLAGRPAGDLGDDERLAAPFPDCAAYVIYTSGSTGRPKGVAVSHRGIASMVHSQRERLGISARSAVLQFSSPGFDAMVFELCMTLATGARLVLAPGDARLPGEELVQLIRRHAVTHVTLIPTVLAMVEEGTLESIETLVVGGEACPEELVRRWAPGRRMVNVYGPTETTVIVTISEPLTGRGALPMGSAIANARIYVLDDSLRPVPAGVPGEICIAGAGLAWGYLNRSAETAARFVPDPFGEPGSRMYRTGDLARRTRSGDLHFLGRADDQLKIRGFRIEPAEVESALLEAPEVAQAVALVREDRPGFRHLVAFVVPAPGAEVDAPALRRRLAGRLPDYMVPSAVVALEAFPVNASGKLDRNALPTPRFGAAEVDEGTRDAVEEVMCGLFAQVLELERVGPEESFFELGGHSLLATRLIGRVRSVLDARVGIRDLFEAPTPRGLAARLDRAGGHSRPVPVAHGPSAPASHAQARLWLTEQFEGPGPRYNIPLVFEIDGALDAAALSSALDDVMARHESLRTVFDEVEGRPVQQILEPAQAGPVLTRVTAQPSRVRAVMAEAARHTFDVACDVPLRAWLVTAEPQSHVLLVLLHHIACDAWSVGPLTRDLSAAYAARVRGTAPEFAPLPIQYADYAIWQQESLGAVDRPGSTLHRQLQYWREALRELPEELSLPYDRPRPATPTHQGAITSVELGRAATEGLELVARENEVTVFMALQAAVATLLFQHGTGCDIPLGTVVAARPDPTLDDLVGFFVNTLVLRTDLSGNPSLRQVLHRVRDTDLAAYAHQDLPFDQLVDALQPARVPGRNPLFQTVIAYLNEDTPSLNLPGARVRAEAPPTDTAKFDLAFTFHHRAGRSVTITLEYSTDLFGLDTAQSLTRLLGELLTDFSDRLDSSVETVTSGVQA